MPQRILPACHTRLSPAPWLIFPNLSPGTTHLLTTSGNVLRHNRRPRASRSTTEAFRTINQQQSSNHPLPAAVHVLRHNRAPARRHPSEGAAENQPVGGSSSTWFFRSSDQYDCEVLQPPRELQGASHVHGEYSWDDCAHPLANAAQVSTFSN